jgi:hypothetical protein
MNLEKIVYPVFLVPKPVFREGLSILHLNKDNDIEYLDDLDIQENTLGKRRLILANSNKKLLELKTALYFLKDIIKLSSSDTQFIDSSGELFYYKKSRLVPLEFKPITKVIPMLSGGALLEIDGENPRYKIMYAPNLDEKYVGLLRVNPHVYLVYGVYKNLHTNTKRKI